MTPAQQQLIRRSWSAIEPVADDAATVFYTRLFELDPNLRNLFSHSHMERQRGQLMEMLSVVVRYIDRLDEIMPEVRALGRRHASYGVQVDHFATVGRALLWTLEQALGDDFTDATAHAWAAAYRHVSSVMIEATQQAATQAALPKRRRLRSAPLPLGWQMSSTPT